MMVLKVATAFASADHWVDQGCDTPAPFVCQDLTPLPTYAVVDSRLTWSNALGYCVARGGSLAKIANQAEHELLMGMLNGTGDAWVGGHDHAQEGTWVWTLDGTSFPPSAGVRC